jgi:hypothetical protein
MVKGATNGYIAAVRSLFHMISWLEYAEASRPAIRCIPLARLRRKAARLARRRWWCRYASLAKLNFEHMPWLRRPIVRQQSGEQGAGIHFRTRKATCSCLRYRKTPVGWCPSVRWSAPKVRCGNSLRLRMRWFLLVRSRTRLNAGSAVPGHTYSIREPNRDCVPAGKRSPMGFMDLTLGCSVRTSLRTNACTAALWPRSTMLIVEDRRMSTKHAQGCSRRAESQQIWVSRRKRTVSPRLLPSRRTWPSCPSPCSFPLVSWASHPLEFPHASGRPHRCIFRGTLALACEEGFRCAHATAFAGATAAYVRLIVRGCVCSSLPALPLHGKAAVETADAMAITYERRARARTVHPLHWGRYIVSFPDAGYLRIVETMELNECTIGESQPRIP